MLVLTLLSLLAASARATITISNPSSASYWVNATANNSLTWSSTANDPSIFHAYVIHDGNTSFQGAYAIANNVQTALGSVNVPVLNLVADTGYQIIFGNISNISDVYATSQSFEIKIQGTTPAPTVSSGGSTPGASGSRASGSSSGSGAASETGKSSSGSPVVMSGTRVSGSVAVALVLAGLASL